MNDELERKIASISSAPRVSQQDVEDMIAEEHFFTASDAVDPNEAKNTTALSLFTICILVTKNGFVLHGTSACASPENYNKEIGEQIAKRNAVSQLWGHMGYALRDKLHRESVMREAAVVKPHDDMYAYIGTKVVNAKAMTRGEYNEFRGWDLPSNENGADEGYLVEYTDKEDGQVEGYKGYVSWSPKDVFDRAYKLV